MLEHKDRHISSGLVRIRFDNYQNYRKLMNEIDHANVYIQDVGTKVAQIRKLLSRIKYKVDIQLIRGHLKVITSFQ